MVTVCNRSGVGAGPEVDPGCGLSNIIDDSSLTDPVTSAQFVLISQLFTVQPIVLRYLACLHPLHALLAAHGGGAVDCGDAAAAGAGHAGRGDEHRDWGEGETL